MDGGASKRRQGCSCSRTGVYTPHAFYSGGLGYFILFQFGEQGIGLESPPTLPPYAITAAPLLIVLWFIGCAGGNVSPTFNIQYRTGVGRGDERLTEPEVIYIEPTESPSKKRCAISKERLIHPDLAHRLLVFVKPKASLKKFHRQPSHITHHPGICIIVT